MTIITFKIYDEKDAEEILEALAKKKEITWNNDTKIANMDVIVDKKIVTIYKSQEKHTPLKF